MKPVKIAVTGAAGQIGYALLFRIASGEMLGKQTPVELNLLELEQALPALNGVAMELDDCAFPLLKNITCTSDVNTAMKGVNWAILVGSMPRKDGMERSDLLKINGSIFRTQGKAIEKNGADDVRIFVVGNPCNTNALTAMHHAPDIPRDRFFAMTTLDENRARALLAARAKTGVTEVSHITIWGNHSKTQYPDFYNGKISGRPLLESISDETWLQGEFMTTVQDRGAAIIKARGSSSAASAANGVIDGIHNLTFDTPKDTTFSMGICSTGQYDIDEGLIFSFPCRTQKGRLNVVEGIRHNEFGEEKIKATLKELSEEKNAVKQLGLI